MEPRTGKVFMSGGSQALRLPAEYRVDTAEVLIERIGQSLLITPLVAALVRQIVEDADGELGEQLRSLRLGTWARMGTLVYDVRFSLVVAVLAAFGRAIAEVGAVLVVGGNIAGFTRTMTTAISLETQKGDLPLALALGIVLMGLVLVVNAIAAALRGYAARRHG